MSSEPQSKRERQKARRSVKLEQQRIADAKAQRNRLIAFGLLGVVFAGLIGAAVWDNRRDAAAARAEEEAVAATLDALGCTAEEKREDLGSAHLGPNELEASPPDTIYEDRPATSGTHFGNWTMTGVYDVVDERVLVHNMEHGYVVAYYDEDAPEDQVTALKEYAQQRIDDNLPKIVVAGWDGALPGEANFAYTAWNVRQMCGEYDEAVFKVFAEKHHSGSGEAPEKELPAHTAEGSGLDPGDEPYLLPPLGEQGSPPEGMSEGAGNNAATESTS